MRDETRYDIIRFYEQQGYVLPDGVTAEQVVEHAKRYDTDPIFMPLVNLNIPGGGVCAWGVPFINGVPLKHP